MHSSPTPLSVARRKRDAYRSAFLYLLTVEQMVENDFPFLHISGTYFNNQKGG
jgi:hypothetical protein